MGWGGFDTKSTSHKSENQQGLHQTKNFMHSKKKKINKMKRKPTEWDKIFANHIPVKGLIFKIYKESTQLNNKKIK